MRARNTASPPCPASAGVAASKGVRLYPTAPKPANHACRWKSKPSGSNGPLGGDRCPVVITPNPGVISASKRLSPCKDTRTCSGVRCVDTLSSTTRSSVSRKASDWLRSTATTRPVIGP